MGQILMGDLGADEREAFEVLCNELNVDQEDAKGVGYFNRLLKLCSVARLKIIIDYKENKFNVEYSPLVNKAIEKEALQEEDEDLSFMD